MNYPKPRRLLTAFCALLWSIPVFASFEVGMQYYDKSEFQAAYQQFMNAAKYGDQDAQFNIGVMHYRGEFVPQNKIEGFAWIALGETPKGGELHKKIYQKLSPDDQKKADARLQQLQQQYGEDAIKKLMTPVYIGTNSQATNYRIIKQAIPEYPSSMAKSGANGIVDIIFTIEKDGTTRDHIVYYSTDKAFSRAAINAFRQWQFEPMQVEGKPVTSTGVKRRFVFALEGSAYDHKKVDKQLTALKEKAEKGSHTEKLAYAFTLETVPSLLKNYSLPDNPNTWYTAAAEAGNTTASYFLGRNILYGNMCSADSQQSMAWLLRAAKNNLADARYTLAIESFSGAHFEKNEEHGFFWLQKAASNYPAARLRLAWLLSTHPDQNKRNGKLAQDYISDMDEDDYLDKQTLFQVQAAVAAENGDFKKAVKWEQKTLKDATKLGLPDAQIKARLASYEAKKPWREEI